MAKKMRAKKKRKKVARGSTKRRVACGSCTKAKVAQGLRPIRVGGKSLEVTEADVRAAAGAMEAAQGGGPGSTVADPASVGA